MVRHIAAATAVLGLIGQPAAAQAPAASPALIRTLAGGCSADAAFGRTLGDVWTGPGVFRLENEAPLRSQVRIETTRRSQRIYDVTALVSFEQIDEPIEVLEASALDLFDAIDAAVVAEGRLRDRTHSIEDEEVTWTVPDSDVTMELSRAGRVGVYVVCLDASLEALNVDEALGRTRVDRPVRPVLDLPPRPPADACADGEQAAALTDGFGDTAMAALDYGAAGSRYAEHLADWIGQQLVDRGVWTGQRKTAFAMSALQDRTIMGEFGQQMPRLETMLEAVMAFAEAGDAGDRPAACAAAAAGLNAIHDIVASNERQWTLMHERYRAEARRLGVTLED